MCFVKNAHVEEAANGILCALLLPLGAFGKVERGILITEKDGYSLEVEVAIKTLKGKSCFEYRLDREFKHSLGQFMVPTCSVVMALALLL